MSDPIVKPSVADAGPFQGLPRPTQEDLAAAQQQLVELFGSEGEAYTVRPDDNVHKVLVAHFSNNLRNLETLSESQARWLIGLMVHLNPELARNPHHVVPGQVLHLPTAPQLAVAMAQPAVEADPAMEALIRDGRAAGLWGLVGGAMRSAITAAEANGADPAMAARARQNLDSFLSVNPDYEKFKGSLRTDTNPSRTAGLEQPSLTNALHGVTMSQIRNLR